MSSFITDPPVEVFGLTVPLLLSPSGEKFGKSAGNALFLDAHITHPFDLYQVLFPLHSRLLEGRLSDVWYQYFLRTSDDHAEQYLKIFTLLPLERIAEISQEHAKAPEKRLAQRILAKEIVTLVHSAELAEKCNFQTAALYPTPRAKDNTQEKESQFKPELILRAFRGDDAILKRLSQSAISGLPLPRLLKDIGLASSLSLIPLLCIGIY